MLHRILYLSDATPGMDTAALRRLVSKAQIANRRQDLTGVLAIGNGTFAQVLEGRAEVVEALLARIAEDPRHHNIVVLSREEIQSRCFDRWAMELLFDESLHETLAAIRLGTAPARSLLDHLVTLSQEQAPFWTPQFSALTLRD